VRNGLLGCCPEVAGTSRLHGGPVDKYRPGALRGPVPNRLVGGEGIVGEGAQDKDVPGCKRHRHDAETLDPLMAWPRRRLNGWTERLQLLCERNCANRLSVQLLTCNTPGLSQAILSNAFTCQSRPRSLNRVLKPCCWTAA